MKASAYLSIFDDWELLETAIASIAPFVDEIVVVDGAYTWLADIIGRSGRDASRSVDAVYETLRRFEPKLRIITGTWKNELDKRMAGFAACRHRYIYRVDADEVLFFDHGHLDGFFASDYPVAEMEMPIYVAPALIRAVGMASPIERQALLFDSTKIDARAHLDYLWLVLPTDEDALRGGADAAKIYPDPIAFNAHLTHWRPPTTAISRARFYVVNYIRGTGDISWLSAFRRTPNERFEALFTRLDPQLTDDFLLGHAIVARPPDMDGFILRPSPLSSCQEQSFIHLYDALLDGLARENERLTTTKRHIVCGVDYNIDLSTPAAVAPFMLDGQFQLYFDTPLAAAKALIYSVDDNLACTALEIPVRIAGNVLTLALDYGRTPLRRTLKLTIWNRDGAAFNRFWVRSEQTGDGRKQREALLF